MKFTLFGMQWDIIAITFYILSLIVTTQILKPLLSKISPLIKKAIIETDYFNIVLSWLVGFVLYFIVLFRILHMEISKESIIQYMFLTTITNGGYKLLKPLVLKLKKLKDLAKEKED